MYTVEPYPDVEEQTAALPEAARAGYDEAVKVMELAPWNGRPYNDDMPNGSMRQLVFGPGGNGMATYLILEDQRRVDVLRVQWVG